MDNSYLQKGASLVTELARSPSSLFDYLRYLPLWKRQPVDVSLPWISFGALRFLEKYINPAHDVFEFGGGGSTLYFANRARSVLTVENHPGWHAIIVRKLAERQLGNAACEFHPITGDGTEQFRDDLFFHRVTHGTWDIVLIDCYCGYSTSRYGYLRPFAFDLALKQVRPGGIMVLDDSWMYRELLAPRAGWAITDFVGPGPCRYGITSTAIFEKLA